MVRISPRNPLTSAVGAHLTFEEQHKPTVGKKPAINAKDAESLRKGLAQLVLQLINLLRQLMEKQAIRRLPSLPAEKQEEVGLHLMLLKEKMDEMREYFGIGEEEMELGLVEGLDDLANRLLEPFVDDY